MGRIRKYFAAGTILVLTLLLVPVHKAGAEVKPIIIDDFESGRIINRADGRTNIYSAAPSRALISIRKDTINGKPTSVLMIKYDKQNKGGPNNSGGWCGYYSILKCAYPGLCLVQGATPVEKGGVVYFNATPYTALTFFVRGEKGGENFKVGIADEHWDQIGDTVKSDQIGKYLPDGKITVNWQKAVLPLKDLFVDQSQLAAISISFEPECFPDGSGQGSVFIDDIAFE